MKKLILIFSLLLLTFLVGAQSPNAFKYQAAIRDPSGFPFMDQNIGVKFIIHQGSTGGTNIYSETHATTTDQFGIIALNIGQGQNQTGNFDQIAWNSDVYFVEILVDLNGGTSYTTLGTSQMLSVPYALLSKNTENNDDADANPTNELQQLSVTGTTAPQVTLSQGGGSVTLQGSGATSLSTSGNTVTISSTDTQYTEGTGIDITNYVITNIGDTNGSDDITTSTNAGGDLSGSFSNLSVIKIQGKNVANTLPNPNEILKWNGSSWAPATDNGQNYQEGTGIDINSGVISAENTNPIWNAAKIQSKDVSPINPSDGQVLKYNNSTSKWEPNLDNNTIYTAGTDINFSGTNGTTINNSKPDQIVSITALGTGISATGTYPNFTIENTKPNATHTGDVTGETALSVVKIQGNAVSASPPANNQFLKWNGSNWAPGDEVDGSITNEIQTLGASGGSSPKIDLTNSTVSVGITSGGTGISTSQSGTNITITNTGDTDATNDITTSTNATGDLSGTYPSPTVAKIQGKSVSSAAPSNNQFLKWNSTNNNWAPGDEVDGSITNEIQTLGASGGASPKIDLTNSAVSVGFVAGTGISVSQSGANITITNTGDTDASNDITTSTTAGGDLSGTYPNPTVAKIQGKSISTTAPSSGQVLKWNGSVWAPAADIGGSTPTLADVLNAGAVASQDIDMNNNEIDMGGSGSILNAGTIDGSTIYGTTFDFANNAGSYIDFRYGAKIKDNNNSYGTLNSILSQDASGIAWVSQPSVSSITSAVYYFSSGVSIFEWIGRLKDKNGSFGSTNQVLKNDGSGRPYWATADLENPLGSSFIINHPNSPDKTLRHNGVMSPENLCLYRGVVELNSNGEGIVILPSYFTGLTKELDATITLTAIGRPFGIGYEWGSDYASFVVYGDPMRQVSYIVLADRDDPVMKQLYKPVEEEKGDRGECKSGKLFYPKAYGYPETYGVGYEKQNKVNKE